MVHRREVNGTELVFGVQGALWGNAMTWWDHDTGSIWSQPIGEAILGPRKGERLELMSSTLTTWQTWRSAHPNTLAMDVRGWPTGFDLNDLAIVVELGGDAVAYSVPALREVGVVNDVVAGAEVAVVMDPNDAGRWAVFSRRLDGAVVNLELIDEGLVDRASGSVFDAFLGVGRSGPLADHVLGRLPSFTSRPDDYLTFFPSGRTWPDDLGE